MKKVVKILCKGFPHVRVDLCNINGKVYFRELTFYYASGFVNSDYWNNKFGSWITLPEVRV